MSKKLQKLDEGKFAANTKVDFNSTDVLGGRGRKTWVYADTTTIQGGSDTKNPVSDIPNG